MKKMTFGRGYFVITGNPFVDAGIYSIEAFYGKNYSDLTLNDLKSRIYDIVDLYLKDGWKKQMYSIFTGNSKFTNNSIKNKRKAAGKFFEDLLSKFSPPGKSGTCIACGRRDAEPVKKRDQIPLTGSGKLINYFAGASEGERYCSVCTFAVQFMPLSLYSVGNRFLLLHSVSSKVMRYWAKEGIKNIREQLISNNFTGCMKEGYSNSENALFHIIERIVRDHMDIFPEENPSITAYIFSNYTQNPPPMEIIHLPNSVFKFLVYVQHIDSASWSKIVRKGYANFKNLDDYKWKRNNVYRNLLSNKSIIGFFIDKNRTVIGNWNILSYYLKEVKGMDKKRVEVLKKVGNKIASYIEKTDNAKRLYALETATTYESFRNVLLKITKDMIRERMNEPLFTTDEFLEDLFPEGAFSWKETRDILLFRIYEKLFDYLKSKNIDESINKEEGI